MVEQLTLNQLVEGSSPSRLTRISRTDRPSGRHRGAVRFEPIPPAVAPTRWRHDVAAKLAVAEEDRSVYAIVAATSASGRFFTTQGGEVCSRGSRRRTLPQRGRVGGMGGLEGALEPRNAPGRRGPAVLGGDPDHRGRPLVRGTQERCRVHGRLPLLPTEPRGLPDRNPRRTPPVSLSADDPGASAPTIRASAGQLERRRRGSTPATR